jgi:hypothetical protein
MDGMCALIPLEVKMLWTYHEMGLDSEESGTDEARSVDSYGGDDCLQDWWYDNSHLSELYAFGSIITESVIRPEFNRLAIIYRIVRHVNSLLIERA